MGLRKMNTYNELVVLENCYNILMILRASTDSE